MVLVGVAASARFHAYFWVLSRSFCLLCDAKLRALFGQSPEGHV